MRNNRFIGFTVIAITILIYGCTEDYFEFDKIKTTDWRPEFAIPLAKSSLTLEEVLINEDSSGLLVPNSQGVVQLIYDGTVLSNLGGERVSIPTFNKTLTQNNILIPAGPPTSITLRDTIEYNLSNGIEVDSLLLKTGNFDLSIASRIQHELQVTATFPSIKNNSGTPLSLTVNLPASDGITDVARADNADLTGYIMDMTLGGTDINKVPVKYEIIGTHVSGNPNDPNDELKISIELENLNFKEFYGYIGQDQFDLRQDTFKIGIFKNFINGTFFLSNPFLELSIQNSYGLPIDLNFDYLNAIYADGQPIDEIQTISGVPFKDTVISLEFDSLGKRIPTKIILDNRSNIDNIVSKLVRTIAYDSKASPNPPGSGSQRNFLSDTSRIGLDVKLTLPLTGYASGFEMIDTVDLSLDGVEELEEGLIRTRVNNGFPIAVDIQLIFTDSNYIPIDTLFKNTQGNLIPGASVDANGNVTQSTSRNTDTQVVRERWRKLKDSKKLLIRAVMETTGANNTPSTIVSFRPEYRVDLAVGFKGTILID